MEPQTKKLLILGSLAALGGYALYLTTKSAKAAGGSPAPLPKPDDKKPVVGPKPGPTPVGPVTPLPIPVPIPNVTKPTAQDGPGVLGGLVNPVSGFAWTCMNGALGSATPCTSAKGGFPADDADTHAIIGIIQAQTDPAVLDDIQTCLNTNGCSAFAPIIIAQKNLIAARRASANGGM